ncbi:MAG TPA: hypothetical protein DCM68_01310, partial [Verrucomicrobia bacterium]|nr:hypothetical protein [Verrucomicrobiota bacterium]
MLMCGLLLAEPVAAATHPLGWGLNADKQASPVPTNVMTDASVISAGYLHSIAVKDGRAWAWGNNSYLQTNVPVVAQSGVTNVAGGGTFSLALKTDGSVIAWGAGIVATNVPASTTSGVTQVAAGEWHALALKDGGVLAWGSNSYGQCNVPDTLTNGVTAVSAGGYYSMALKDGGVQVFGIDATNGYAYGIRDVPAEASTGVQAISAGRWHALALKNGGVIAWGAPHYDATNVPASATSGVTAIAAGDCFSIARKTNGTLVIWGDDTKGQLPIPNYASNGVSQIAAGMGHCLVVCTAMPPRFVDARILPDAYRGHEYTNGFVQAAGDPAVRYYTTGSWPAWMSLNATNGAITGTPTALGMNYFTVIASNAFGRATNSYQVNVLELTGPPILVTTNLPDGVLGAPYNQQIVASNLPVVFSLTGNGNLPPGLNMDTNGWISGIPTTVNPYGFEIRATNNFGTSNRYYYITIQAPAGAPVLATTNPLPSAVVGQPYFFQIEADNYPTNFSLLSGALPDGLGLTTAGAVTGTPTQIQSANFTVVATNMAGSDSETYDLNVLGPPIFVTESPLPDGVLGSAYSFQIVATGDALFSRVAGILPNGLGLTSAGMVTGTPTVAGPFNFTVRATNDYGWTDRDFALTIGSVPVFVTTSPLPGGTSGVPYSVQIVATGATAFSLESGSLPGGLNLSGAGLLSGTPSGGGAFNFTVRAT